MTTKQCTACGQSFTPVRRDKVYCSDNCRKKQSRNAARGGRGHEYKRAAEVRRCRTRDLEEMVYKVPPNERLGQLKLIFDALPHDSMLRSIVTDPELLKAPPRANGTSNIAKMANWYSQRFFEVSIKGYLGQR